MRIPEPGPLGETFVDARERAMVEALLLNRPASGWVESVVTFADHFLFFVFRAADFPFVAMRPSRERVLRIYWMRIEEGFAASFAEKVGEHAAAFIGEDTGGDFDAMVELWVVEDRQDRAAGSSFRIVGGVEEAGDACVQDCAGAHGTGFEGDVEDAAAFGGEDAVVG